jgi:hypothetical protein
MTKLNRRLAIIAVLFFISALLLGYRLATMSAVDPVFVGAGDIADCETPGDEETAALLDKVSGTIFTLGDNAYPTGETADFRNCYEKSWGRHKARTLPSAGNHDYYNSEPYFTYFGEKAGDPDKGYYSLNLGAWHIIALNSNIDAQAGSEQEEWLRSDLAANKAQCTLALWHHPLFSSGEHGNDPRMLDIWRTLFAFKADVILNAHDHNYERFAPQDPDGKANPLNGITEFVVGTGGSVLRGFPREEAQTHSEVKDNKTWGVLKMTLQPTAYKWEFVPVAGGKFNDSGNASCIP